MSICPNDRILQDIKKELYGNGRKGLVKEFEQYKVEFKEMKEDLNKLATSYSDLVEAVKEREITDKLKAKASQARAQAIKLVGVVFGIAFGAVGTLYVVLDHIAGN